MKFKTAHFIAGAIIVSAAVMPFTVLACGEKHSDSGLEKGKIHMTALENNMVVGTVTAISGTTLTVTDAKNVVYTVNASKAKIDPGMMGNSGLTIANIMVGDKVVITGPVTGTTEIAKKISDRAILGRNIFMGTVTAVNGSVVTIDTMANKAKTSYTVNISSATLLKGMGKGVSIAVSDIKVGDRVFAIGTLSGTNVSATSVRDLGQIKKANVKPFFGQGKFKMRTMAHRGLGNK